MAGTMAGGELARIKVLVVEDEYFLADDLSETLRSLGAEVAGPAPTMDQAFALLERGDVQAAVLDINLRGEAVFALAEALRRMAVPFVFATGYDEAAIPESYRDVPRWEKPLDAGDLARKLQEIVRAGRGPLTAPA